MSLHTLALEIVRIILEDCDRGSLLNLALVNRSFNREAEMILYRVVCPGEDSLSGFLNAVKNSQFRANHVQLLTICRTPDTLHHLIGSTLPSLSSLQELCVRFEAIPEVTSLVIKNTSSSLVSLDVDMPCGPPMWDVLHSLQNLRHLEMSSDVHGVQEPHVCRFPNNIVPQLSSIKGDLSCIANILSNRPVTAICIMSPVDDGLLTSLVNDLTSTKLTSEITTLKLGFVTGLGDIIISKIAKHFSSLKELHVGSLLGGSGKVLELENWGESFCQMKSLQRLTVITMAFPLENCASIITSWTDKCPHLSSITVYSYDRMDYRRWEGFMYKREKLGQPGVLDTISSGPLNGASSGVDEDEHQ